MKLHAKDDDNEYLHSNIKSYWYENEKKEKKKRVASNQKNP